MAIEYNHTFHHTIADFAFGGLAYEVMVNILSDGRVFSHFIERWLPMNYPIIHITGCKSYDHVDATNPDMLYDQKTFTKGGCNFCPSNMLGQGRSFNPEVFQEKSKKLNYIIVSNIDFPNIRVRFVRGEELATLYPTGKIPLKDFDKFFA